MRHASEPRRWTRRLWALLLGMGLLVSLGLSEDRLEGAPKKAKQPPTAKKQVAPPAPRSAQLTVEEWQKAPMTPLVQGEIDALVAKELQANKIEPAPLTTDEQFVRRVTLDLTGELPLPADVTEFVANTDSHKRAKLIDRLLESDEYARHWARYWRDVVTARLTERRSFIVIRNFEEWLFHEFKSNARWDKMVREMLTAQGEIRFDEVEKNGAAFFLASHRGPDAVNERAAETARIFMGIQIQCAQCHDHPSDQWKRVQFHELAGYFARLNERIIREDKRLVGLALVSKPAGEHEMPDKKDPKLALLTPPRFLNGNSPGKDLPDMKRRQSLAHEITDKNNYWFAGAYVNRVWGVLMGQSFYEPVDDMGPQKTAVYPAVLTRLTGSYRGSSYNVKTMFRDILNSQTYQRQIRLGEASDQHLHFAAAYPTKLPADALWQSLIGVLGQMGPKPQAGNNSKPNYGMGGGLEGLFKQEFGFDPSLKPDEVEGSIPQALFLMNNPAVNQRIQAKGANLLGRILSAYPKDDEALQALYLRALARKPTDREFEKCRKFIKETPSRAEAFEDILWALINSTEFQTKR